MKQSTEIEMIICGNTTQFILEDGSTVSFWETTTGYRYRVVWINKEGRAIRTDGGITRPNLLNESLAKMIVKESKETYYKKLKENY